MREHILSLVANLSVRIGESDWMVKHNMQAMLDSVPSMFAPPLTIGQIAAVKGRAYNVAEFAERDGYVTVTTRLRAMHGKSFMPFVRGG